MTNDAALEATLPTERCRGELPDELTHNRLAYVALRQEIVQGRRGPNEKLNIAAIAEQLKVSAGAVREALAMLEADSLVLSSPQRGYRVVPASASDLNDLVAARIEIERLCIAEAIRRGDDAWEGAIISALHRLTRQHERDATDKLFLAPAWTSAHADFHGALIGACKNAWLLRLRATLYQQSERYRQLSVPLATAPRDICSEHEALVKAVLDRDSRGAARLIANHLRRTADLVLASSFF